MNSNYVWLQYEAVWICFIASAFVPLLLWAVRRYLQIDASAVSKRVEKESVIETRFNTRYLSESVSISGLIFLVMILFPVGLVMGSSKAGSTALYFSAGFIFFGSLMLGILVLYLKRKGDLDWEADQKVENNEF